MYISNFATWASSAVLHSTLFLPSKEYVGAAIAGGTFLILGTLSTGVKISQKRDRQKENGKTLDMIVNE